MDATISFLIAIATGLGYLGLAALTWRSRDNIRQSLVQWLLAVLGIGLLTSIAAMIPTDTQLLGEGHLAQPALAVYGAGLVLVLYGGLTLEYLQQEGWARGWLIAGSGWWIAVIVLSLAGAADQLVSEDWLSEMVDNSHPASMVAVFGWIGIGSFLLINVFQRYYSARLPEIANQALFWGVMMPLVLLGAVFSASGVEFLREIGWVIQLGGVAGVAYSVITNRVVDIRETLRLTTVNIALALITALAILMAIFAAYEADPDADNRILVYAGLSLVAAVIHTPVYLVAAAIINRIMRRGAGSAAMELSRFSQAITGVVELDEVAEVVLKAVNDVLRVRRSGLILATADQADRLLLETYSADGSEAPTVNGALGTDSPIYKQLRDQRKTLLQYDLSFAREYHEVVPTEREFFQQMSMSAYAPIVVQDRLIGILACGPKANDAPFSASELELLGTLANQTGIALRNARLVDDLRKREHDVAESNKRLEATKRQLEALDAVKTDFITIASHELRTPLAQLRGHTDIIDALNEQGMMNEDQLRGLTANLRKATDRLETLIGDMLDVSQLDLSALDLRFAQSSIENVVRMAIEPLQESIRNRKQSLTARGLRGLPQLEADMQRLVQAVRNVVLNAVKFTPDGGRIDIVGSLIKNERTGQDEIQLMIKDSGVGIDKKNLEAIFEKFFRTGDPGLHSTGATKFMGAGPGLGLTIAQGVISGHGGRIWAESEGHDPEKLPGSTFYIVLPLKREEGHRYVMSFGSSAPSVSDSQSKRPDAPPVHEPELDEEDNEAPFIERDPTVVNPSAARAGLAAAAKAAAEKAQQETEKTDDSSPDES